jgi:hypothetical protein
MTTMVDRYIEVALSRIPGGSRNDVEREMRGMIDELVDGRIEQGEEPDIAIEHVLNELGNPRDLAREYGDGRRYLVGPDQYDSYVDLLKAMLTRVLPFVTVIVFMVQLLGSDESDIVPAVLDAVGESVWMTLNAAVHIVFWVTVVFVVLDRTGASAPGDQRRWTVADLPAPRTRRQIPVADALTGLAFTLLIGIFLVIVYRGGVDLFTRDGEGILSAGSVPFFNPDIPQSMAWLVLVLLAADTVVECLKLNVGNWTRGITGATVLLAVVWAVVAMVIIGRWGLVNPGIGSEMSDDLAEIFLSSWFELSVLAVAIASSAIDIWDAVRGYLAWRTPDDEWSV